MSRPRGISARAWFYGQPGFHQFDTLTSSPERRGDMTRDLTDHTTAYAAASGDERPEAVPAHRSTGETNAPNKLPGSNQSGATPRRGAGKEALRSVGSAGEGPASDDDVSGIEADAEHLAALWLTSADGASLGARLVSLKRLILGVHRAAKVAK